MIVIPRCSNCGEHVTEQYVRVFEPVGATEAECCPHCPDMAREGSEAVENFKGRRV